jgi:DNA mismatch repair ATPase MutL
MSSKQNINVKGTVLNLLDEGFDLISSLKEITDNSFGAGAKRIRFFIDMKNLTLYVLDDGKGMNKQELTKLATLNMDRE